MAGFFWWRRGSGPLQAYRAATLGFGLGAVLSLPAQLWVLLVVQHGHTHRADAPWASPFAPQFWEFIVGIVGRAIGFSGTASGWAFTVSLLVMLALVALLLVLLWRSASRSAPHDDEDDAFAFVYSALGATVLFYLCMVAAGRANLGAPTEQTALGSFALGQGRFYFFWVSLLIPWVLLAIMRLMRGSSPIMQNATALVLGLLLLAMFLVNGAAIFGLAPYYRFTAQLKQEGLECLRSKIPEGPPYLCPSLFPADLSRALDYAALVGAKFTVYLPAFRPDQANAALWQYETVWRMDKSTIDRLGTINGSSEQVEGGLRIAAKDDLQVIVDIAQAAPALHELPPAKIPCRSQPGQGEQRPGPALLHPGRDCQILSRRIPSCNIRRGPPKVRRASTSRWEASPDSFPACASIRRGRLGSIWYARLRWLAVIRARNPESDIHSRQASSMTAANSASGSSQVQSLGFRSRQQCA